MANDPNDTADETTKSSKMPLVIGLVLALIGGAGGFYATWNGLLLSPKDEKMTEGTMGKNLPDISYVEVDPLVVAIATEDGLSHLRFRTQLEVPASYKADVELLKPRVIDVLNGYLRALHMSDIQDPSALARLRAQMLRRVQVVTGEGRINDLLIMEFVIN